MLVEDEWTLAIVCALGCGVIVYGHFCDSPCCDLVWCMLMDESDLFFVFGVLEIELMSVKLIFFIARGVIIELLIMVSFEVISCVV